MMLETRPPSIDDPVTIKVIDFGLAAVVSSHRGSMCDEVGTYAYMSVMETLGFAKYFRDPLVALVGGLGMIPIAGVAVTRKLQR